jgi:hypothetical protein
VKKKIRITLIYLTGIIVILTGCSSVGERDSCVSEEMSLEGTTAFYELVDPINKQVWGTSDFTPREYAEFKPPLFWQKNDPRGDGWPDGGKFLRSPGCLEDGQFTYLNAFDRKFLNVVKLININKKIDKEGFIRGTVLEKYHRLFYSKGTSIPVLHSPTGERFIGVSRSIDRTTETFTLPEGWTLTTQKLEKDLQVELYGEVMVLRTDNEDSFQGPLSDGIVF